MVAVFGDGPDEVPQDADDLGQRMVGPVGGQVVVGQCDRWIAGEAGVCV
jgi:hypothetical protein